MTKRYKVLDGALKYLRTDDDDPNPQAPANTPLREYQTWKAGERNIEYEREEDSLPEELLKVVINPFGETFDAENKYIVDLSKRTNDFNGISTLRAAGNIVDVLPDNANNVKGFIPAKCTVAVPDSTKDDPNAESQITKIKYFKKGFRSYTFPYGAGSATDREKTVRNAILDAIPDGSNYTVTFTSEKL